MKFKSAIIGLCLSITASAFADSHHLHPQANKSDESKPASTELKYPGYCEIEIINDSFSNIMVYGTFDDGMPLQPFTMGFFTPPQYIDLFYPIPYGYCHPYMNLFIDNMSGYHIYAGYTPPHTTIRVTNWLKDKQKAELIQK